MAKSRIHSNPHSTRDLDPFPMYRLKRVDVPTTEIVGDVQRVDERESGFNRAYRGDFGEKVVRERPRFVQKHPISATLAEMAVHMRDPVDGRIAEEKAPLPDDPASITRHIKELAYFLRSDLVGICELPKFAVYSHDQFGNEIDLDHKYAICVLIDQDYKTYHGTTGRGWISNAQSFISYSVTAWISVALAAYIRRLGYPARAHHARNYQVVVPPIYFMPVSVKCAGSEGWFLTRFWAPGLRQPW
ncbi:MAG TPA: hypothetical protein GXZ24_05055 [Firmicutes bacterium]|nr:hypothetical protein [Bacillota bacterium]